MEAVKLENKKENLTEDKSKTPQEQIENEAEVQDVSDTQVIDAKQLKELSMAATPISEENADETKSCENAEQNDISEADSANDDSLSQTEEPNSIDDAKDSEAVASDLEYDDTPEGQLTMFDDEDDFTSPDDENNSADDISSVGKTKTIDENITNEQPFKFEFNISIPPKVKKSIIIIASALVLIFVAAYIVGYSTLPTNTIYKNVYIEDIPVGGMTQSQALEAISSKTLFKNQDINISYLTKNYTIDGASISLEASLEATAKKAYNYGKTGNKFIDAFYNTLLIFSKHTVMPVANIDTDKLDEHITKFGIQCHGELKEHNIVVQADGLVYIGPGQTGFDNNVDLARAKILKSLENDRFTDIKVPLSSASPSDLTLEEFDASVYCDPIDAHYEYTDSDVIVVPEQIGRYINKEEAAPLLTQVREGGQPVYIPWYKSDAAITADMMQEKLFNTVLGSFPTYYGGAYNRNKNVERAASLINNAVVPPGEVFSFNDRVGRRTVANGFFTAPEYANGQTVQGIGGGTCQVSTTLYGAVLYADMDIVSRTEHMFTVGYAPLGQDATVADGSLDFKFRNSSDYPIKITTTTSGGKITVNILGTAWDPAKKVELRHAVSRGTNTYVSSKRLVYDGEGNLIKTETLPSSVYRPHVQN